MSGVELVIVTGLSGAGRSTALRVLEDLGFYCVDNLPPKLAPALLEFLQSAGGFQQVGLGIDVRTGAFLEGTELALDELNQKGFPPEILVLDASDEAIVRRFSETRRPHRLAADGDLPTAIRNEREDLAMLFEEFMMSYRHGVQYDAAYTNKYVDGMTSASMALPRYSST